MNGTTDDALLLATQRMAKGTGQSDFSSGLKACEATLIEQGCGNAGNEFLVIKVYGALGLRFRDMAYLNPK
jgi:hypothetical protein